MEISNSTQDAGRMLREDLALALRAADHHGLAEGVCNHFSVAVDANRFLINPRGLHWSEVQADDILLVDDAGEVLERAAQQQVLAASMQGRLRPIADEALARRTAAQIQGERMQSDLFFEALRRMLPPRR